MLRRSAWLGVWLLCVAPGCLEEGYSVKGDAPPGEAVTFYRDVEPLLQSKCQGCHVTGGAAPFPLVSYDEVRAQSAGIAAAVEARVMPPWPPSRRGVPLLHDRSLSDAQVATVRAWVEQGAPEGSRSEHRERSADLARIRSDLLLQMPEPYTPSAAEAHGAAGHVHDDFRCFALGSPLPEARFVTGYELRPGVAAMMHHAVLYVVPAPLLGQLQALDAADPAPGYRCMGGPGVEEGGASGARVLGSWKPGQGASPLPAGTGIRVAAGEQLVLQAHYTLLNGVAPDLSTVALELSSGGVQEAFVYTLRNNQFLIPAGASEHPVEQHEPLLRERTLYSVFPHMHFLGAAVSVTLRRREGTQLLLVDIPHWDFDWQGSYELATPLRLSRGDALILRCVFDNSAAHQPRVNGAVGPPRDVGWGDGTLDEMCLSHLYFTEP